MKPAALALALCCSAAFALPPVTEAEAIKFHTDGLCSFSRVPGTGLTRPDGDGYVVSSLIGPHSFFTTAPNGKVYVNKQRWGLAELAPGFGVQIHVEPPGAPVQWCVKYRPPGRDECGPVPQAFLYDAQKVKDRQ